MRKGLGLAGLVLAGMLGMGSAQAAPMPMDSGLAATAPADAGIEKAQYYARPYGYGYRRHFGPRPWGWRHRHFGHRGWGYHRGWGHRHGWGHRRYRY